MATDLCRFLLVGAANTAVGYCLILFLRYGLHFGSLLANLGGYGTGVVLSYTLNRNFTFSNKRPHFEAVPRFCLVFCLCFVFNILILESGMLIFDMPYVLAQALAVCGYTISFYKLNRLYVFVN